MAATVVHDANKGNSNDSNQSAASRAELWRQAKRQRAAEWAAFNASRPDDTYDAPEDIAALQHAAATIGDFKLKSDPGFMLPEVQERRSHHCSACRHRCAPLLRQNVLVGCKELLSTSGPGSRCDVKQHPALCMGHCLPVCLSCCLFLLGPTVDSCQEAPPDAAADAAAVRAACQPQCTGAGAAAAQARPGCAVE